MSIFKILIMNITVDTYHDKRYPRAKKNEQDETVYPIKLRITKDRIQKYYSIPNTKTGGVSFEATIEEWEKIDSNTAVRGRLRDIKLQKSNVIQEAEEIIKEMDEFSFDRFKEIFHRKSKNQKLFDVFEEYIQSLKDEDRISTAQSYQCALNSFKLYDPNMNFDKVDKTYLNNYERWLLSQTKGKYTDKKNSPTTVGIYTRSLRTIFNIANNKGLTKNYPFGKNEYTPPSGENIKKALDLEDINKIKNYEAVSKSPMDLARDLWIFSYFSNGMNFKDICSIKEEDIKGDMETIEFVREKTNRSNRNKIEVLIIPETKAIIEKWGQIKGDAENYVFPFIKQSDSEEQKRKKVQQLVKNTNKYLKRISEELELPITITTYHARHSFASILKESGAPLEYISEAMGHSNPQTTESYLKSFSRAHKEKWAEVLRGEDKA